METREKPTSTPESGADLAVTPMRGPPKVVLRRRPVAEVETAAEHLLHFLGKRKMALPLEIGMNS